METIIKREKPLEITSDIMFKKLFGEVEQSEFLGHFLRSVLEMPAEESIDIYFDNTHLYAEYPDKRTGIVDVRVTLSTGEIIHVEIQVRNEDSFSERMLFYNFKILISQLKRNAKFSELKKVVSIYIMDFDHFDDDYEGFHDMFFMNSVKSGRMLSDAAEIHTIELSKVPKGESDESIVNFLNFIKAKNWGELEMVAKSDPVIKKAVARVVELSADEQLRRFVEAQTMAEHDLASRIEYHEKKGRAEGREEVNIENARIMLLKGYPLSDIAEITGLSENQISAIVLD